MDRPRVFVDPMKTDDQGRLVLVCVGTREDLRKHGIALSEGTKLHVWSDDANDHGERDDLVAEGTVEYNADIKEWVLRVDVGGFKHQSELRQLREFRAIIWTSDPMRPGQRVTVEAVSLEDARKRLEEMHGEGTVFDLHNEEDANKPR